MSQTSDEDNKKRIAKHTLILHVRMLFTVGISFLFRSIDSCEPRCGELWCI